MYYSWSTTLVVLIAFRSVEGLLWGAEPRFELGPAVQQAGALLSEPHRTLDTWALFNSVATALEEQETKSSPTIAKPH